VRVRRVPAGDALDRRFQVIEAALLDERDQLGAELSSLVQERCFYSLEAPVERVTGWDTPYPHSLEWAYFPGPVRLSRAIEKVLEA